MVGANIRHRVRNRKRWGADGSPYLRHLCRVQTFGDIVNAFVDRFLPGSGVIFEIYGLEQLSFLSTFPVDLEDQSVSIDYPGSEDHAATLRSIDSSIITLVNTDDDDGKDMITQRDDITFGTVDDHFASDTFGELSELEIREYREGRRPRVYVVVRP